MSWTVCRNKKSGSEHLSGPNGGNSTKASRNEQIVLTGASQIFEAFGVWVFFSFPSQAVQKCSLWLSSEQLPSVRLTPSFSGVTLISCSKGKLLSCSWSFSGILLPWICPSRFHCKSTFGDPSCFRGPHAPASPENVSGASNVSLISPVTRVICRGRRLTSLERLCGGVFFTRESDCIDYAEEQLSMRNLASSTFCPFRRSKEV